MLYNLTLWQDQHIQNLAAFQEKFLNTLERIGQETGQSAKFFEKLAHERKLIREHTNFFSWGWATFCAPRSDSSWTNDVEVRVVLEEAPSTSPSSYIGLVACRTQISGGLSGDTLRYAELLTKVATAMVELDKDLALLVKSLGKNPEDKAKVKKYKERRRRKTFVDTELHQKLKGSLFVRVRDFCETLLAEFLEQTRAGNVQDLALERRFPPKERKLLNEVPDTVFEVTHERGGPSTVKLTAATLDLLLMRLEDKG